MIRMSAIATAMLSIAALAAAPANAADIARPVYKAPVVVAPVAYNWSGFYLGGFAGAAFGGDSTVTDVDNWNALGSQWSYGTDTSFIGGGTIGINWQAVGSPWVFGVEGELGYIKLKGSAADPISPALDTWSNTKIGDWYGFVGGRLGYAWDRTLVYAKGGAAFVDVNVGITDSAGCIRCIGGGTINADLSDTVSTWAVGGGIEWAWVNNWTFKIEYLYIDLDKSYTACGNSFGTFCWQHDIESIHTVKAGLNYKFDWGKSPVMAKY